MDNALNLLGGLILALLGFILPIITILLSLLPEGVKALINKYENEKKQSEDNIATEINKRGSKNIDLIALEKTIGTLNKNKKDAELKIDFLKPNKLLKRISFPLVLSFIGVIILLQHFSSLISWISLVSVFSSLLVSIWVLKISFEVLFEVSNIVSESKQNSQEKVIELLSKLVEENNEGKQSIFIDTVSIFFQKSPIIANKKYKFSANKQHTIPVAINNSGDIMAKNVEVGLIFPKEFLVEKTSSIDSFYTGEENQILRFKEDFVQASTNQNKGEIKITFLKAGEHKASAFIKGENIKNERIEFVIDVVE